MPEENLPESQTQSAPPPVATPAAGSLMDQVIVSTRMTRDVSQQPYAQDLLRTFAEQVVDHDMKVGSDTVASLNTRIAQIDQLISDQVNEILHTPQFQKLESSWRGLHYFVHNSETGSQLKIRVLNATMKELGADMEKAPEFDQSALFKKVYEEEYGTYGGNPYGLLVGDYEFGRHPQDIGTLEKISHVAAAAHAPFVSAASPSLFDWDSFSELSNPRDLSKGFETAELTKWRSFRESEDSRYVALTMPHILLRLPYGPDTVPVEGVDIVENVNGNDNSKFLWGNSAYALAQRITNAFSLYSWCAAIRGALGGGLVEGLPAYTFKSEAGDSVLKCPTEITITDRREKELNDLGFVALLHCKGTDYAAFFGGQTVNKPKLYNTDSANANSRISSMLPYILAASRFAHFIKVMMRDRIGTFMTRDSVQEFLNTWISGYILLNDNAAQSVKARLPLREARVDVSEVPGKPGIYKAVVFLKPHFQLDELSVSLRLVAELPPPAAA